LTPDPR